MRLRDWIIPRIDISGGAVVLLAVYLSAWFGVFKPNSAAAKLGSMRHEQVDLQTEHSKLQKLAEQNVAEWQALKEEARREGNLDDQAPVQQRLRAIREMTAGHGWVEVVIMPVQWRQAGDVAEHIFRVTAVADYIAALAFFREFEQCALWADISHLCIKPIPRVTAQDREVCSVEITLNFYSSYQPDAASRSSG